MSSVQEVCSQQYDQIPAWKFWRRHEREFWFGGILAAYAEFTGSEHANTKAEAIFDKYYPESKRWVEKALKEGKSGDDSE